MTRIMLTLALAAAAAMAHAQGTPAMHPTATATPPPAAGDKTPAAPQTEAVQLPPDQAVITIHGVCDKSAGKKGECATTITRAQFDRLVSAVNNGRPPLAAAPRRALALKYVELLALVQAAAEAGIESDPMFQEAVRLDRLQKMSEFYLRTLDQKSRNVSDEEIAAYYKQNSIRYEELVLSRIFLPRNNPSAKDKDAWEKSVAKAAEDVRVKAAQGANLETLQKETYTALGLTMAPPPVSMGARRKGMMPIQEEEAVFPLKPGEVSGVIAGPTSFAIYKLESRKAIPPDRVKDEITREIQHQKLEALTKAVTGGAHGDLNDQYFGPPPPPAAAPGTSVTNPHARPVSPR